MKRALIALASALLVVGAHAQSANPPLNLKLPNDMPPSSLPASSSTSAAKPSTDKAANTTSSDSNSTRPKDAPGVYYGDTSGRMGNTEVASDARRDCDDSTYNQPQVHGSIGMGVMAGNHVSGNYQTGSVSVSKAFGSCDDPHGGISFSVSSGTGNFHGRGRGH